MKARWKRNAVVATMAVLVCAAVALNWRYTSDQAVSQMEQAQSEETGTKILGQATLVSGVEDGADDAGEADGAADGGEAVDETAVYTGSDYFASARLTRQQARTAPSRFCRRRRSRKTPTRRWPTRPRRESRCWRPTRFRRRRLKIW